MIKYIVFSVVLKFITFLEKDVNLNDVIRGISKLQKGKLD